MLFKCAFVPCTFTASSSIELQQHEEHVHLQQQLQQQQQFSQHQQTPTVSNRACKKVECRYCGVNVHPKGRFKHEQRCREFTFRTFRCSFCNHEVGTRKHLHDHITQYHVGENVVTHGIEDARLVEGGDGTVSSLHLPVWFPYADISARETYLRNLHVIGQGDHVVDSDIVHEYNFPLLGNELGLRDIERHLWKIFNAEIDNAQKSFKISLSLGFILSEVDEQDGNMRYVYFHPGENNSFFGPVLISEAKDVRKIIKQISAKDLLENVQHSRPKSR